MASNGNEVLSPRPRKAVNPQVARAYKQELHAPSLDTRNITPAGTPAPPDDAPPSVKAVSAARRELRKKTNGRIFPTVDYQERVSYFDPRSSYSNFRGFFVLFWIGLGIMATTSMLRNLKETGLVLSFRQWPLFTENIWELAASDLLMAATTGVDLPLSKLYKNSKGWLRWEKGGIFVQCAVQAVWLYVWIAWPFARDWTWTAQVFFTLHTLALFMKMHSYAFYCGHLATTFHRLKELDLPLNPETPTTAAVHYPRTFPFPETTPPTDGAADGEDDEYNNISPIIQLRNDLAKELTSPLGNTTYPHNLTLPNFIDYLLCPTLCYELEYPRTPSCNYLELFYKTLAVFGCIFLLTIVSEDFIIPVLDDSHLRLQAAPTITDRALIFAETVSAMLFPFMVTFLLVFLVIFEYVLGAFAEITQFADRQFYSDWWNSLDWLEFSREWNIPVHNFFRRHVYSASRGVKLSRPVATGITFFISAVAHELVMGCITRKFRGYGFVMMMLQMPIVMVQRLPMVRGRSLLNNIMFWLSMISGLSLREQRRFVKKLDAEALRLRLALEVEVAYQSPFVNESHDFTQML
ncbi:Sterol O-acyltransferase 2 (Sterol-ester synthase 2) [Extremus antarcticus]|uniref:O-acyltransferase n=1 Tax=Extremus antarcticus TaxID=702011 RepID=A0AAJ0DRG7_9PEZI|nr:Sterol O-acyltransferase 2 (Sterol-ester synthase 2) [Extremus antarcticus]